MCEPSTNVMGDAMMAGIMNVLMYRLLISSRIFIEFVKQILFNCMQISIFQFYEKLSKKKEPFCHQPLP